jgi:eukaryotic translation initiation factor 2C
MTDVQFKCLNKSSPEYAGIKAACDVTLGVPSQNLLVQKMQKAGPQYWSNVALKVNVKLVGGVNHRIAKWLPGFDKNPTCVMGAESVRFKRF